MKEEEIERDGSEPRRTNEGTDVTLKDIPQVRQSCTFLSLDDTSLIRNRSVPAALFFTMLCVC